jgi:hypothetical protein
MIIKKSENDFWLQLFCQILNDFSSPGCREDFLEVSGSRICGSQVGSVLFPVDKNSGSSRITFKSDQSGSLKPPFSIVTKMCGDLSKKPPAFNSASNGILLT